MIHILLLFKFFMIFLLIAAIVFAFFSLIDIKKVNGKRKINAKLTFEGIMGIIAIIFFVMFISIAGFWKL